MKGEVKRPKEIGNKLLERERKSSNTPPSLLPGCVKALTRVV
jgi:hypothetical protein